MKFEKISKDKIKVTLNTDDLNKNNIDLTSFLSSDSDTSHSLFLNVLETAERDYGFTTENYNLRVETIALSNGSFILTITRVLDNSKIDSNHRSGPKANRKSTTFNADCVIYKMKSFDDFCKLSNILNNLNIKFSSISKNCSLYSYLNKYYLVLEKINLKNNNLKGIFAIFTEFAVFAGSSNVIIAKLNESGKIIFKNRAFQNCLKYFSD